MSKDKGGTGDYEVGFCRPPKSTRFKAGKSGNPKGRPKDVKSVDEVLRKRLFAKITVQEGGTRKRISVLEAIIGRLIKNAAEGDLRSFAQIAKLLPQLHLDRDQSADIAFSPETDRQVLEEFARLLGSPLNNLVESAEGARDAQG